MSENRRTRFAYTTSTLRRWSRDLASGQEAGGHVKKRSNQPSQCDGKSHPSSVPIVNWGSLRLTAVGVPGTSERVGRCIAQLLLVFILELAVLPIIKIGVSLELSWYPSC
ncbi:uncharacterized protein F4812DRAFT_458042 [Daldinia caldariorum]|uniref:uncharacterized protein n=1 Tax=Daldinia caldariorum TaxID=326644 RepID=UPI002007D04E|nr:uncharacterized protein F4812DRAFT_458042 [Daldinia caldariorum]KAI1469505.1 hypothetical protein F4812DRAFT_458042 [Daldinia caldariorum]